jgi:hypothetical protein
MISWVKVCEEIQLVILHADRRRIPITVNASLSANGRIYWSLFNASKRDQLYEELIKTRKILEIKADKLKLLASTDELTELLNRR